MKKDSFEKPTLEVVLLDEDIMLASGDTPSCAYDPCPTDG